MKPKRKLSCLGT